MTRSSDCLMVFAKYPEPGKVKTRLAQMTTPEESASFFEASLLDSLDAYLGLEYIDILLFMAGEDKLGFSDSIPNSVQVFEQIGNGLGERMSNAFDQVFEIGYRSACIIGTDHPSLDLGIVQTAFTELSSSCDIVVGPSEDGGYYLIGMSRSHPRLFEGMNYSHDQVFSDTLQRADEYSMDAVKVLTEWYDVDEPEDLKRLSLDLESTSLHLPRVRKVVSELSRKYRDHSRFNWILKE